MNTATMNDQELHKAYAALRLARAAMPLDAATARDNATREMKAIELELRRRNAS